MSNITTNDQLNKERPRLGEWCNIYATVSRVKTPIYTDGVVSYAVSWDEFDSNHPQLDCITSNLIATPIEPTTALYIGYRSLPYGATNIIREVEYFEGYSGGHEVNDTEWKVSGHVEVWLFVTDPRRRPVQVFPNDAIRIERQL